MALKHKITKAIFDKLSDELKAEYTENDDGKGYTLDVDGIEDTGELKRGKDRANADLKEARKKLKEAEARLEELDGDDARKSGDIDKITGQMKSKHEAQVAELTGTIDALKGKLITGKLESTASEIAGRIAKSPKVMLPHIKGKLAAELDEEFNVVLKVLGDDGKPSTTSLKNFEEGLVNDKDFADIIIGSKASGGGGATRKDPTANGGAGRNSPFDTSDQSPPANLAKIAPSDMVARIQARKEAAGA